MCKISSNNNNVAPQARVTRVVPIVVVAIQIIIETKVVAESRGSILWVVGVVVVVVSSCSS